MPPHAAPSLGWRLMRPVRSGTERLTVAPNGTLFGHAFGHAAAMQPAEQLLPLPRPPPTGKMVLIVPPVRPRRVERP